MYLYNFDIANQKIIQYNNKDSNAMITELFQPLLSFVNIDFSEYDILRRKIRRFIQKSEQKFEELDSAEIETEIKKDFPDFKPCGIDNGETWWIAELSAYLYFQSPYEPFFFVSELDKNAVQNESNYDYLYWQKIIQDKVYEIFDIDNKFFIDGFSPMCRLSHCYNQSFHFNEVAIIHPTDYEKHTDGSLFFNPPFNPDNDPSINDSYIEKEPQRQEFIQKHLYVINGYKFNSLEDAFNCEIFKMAQIGIYLKRCANCGKYFIFNPNKPARYCSNKLPNINMTCQQVAAQKKYKDNQSPIQKAYINALKNRNKWYPSKKSGLRTLEQTRQYEDWKSKTSAIRDDFQQKYDNAQTDSQRKIILEEFKQNLNK